MGQKVNPIGLRLGLTQTWRSRWYAEGKQFADYLEEDIKIRKFVRKTMQRAAISRIEIERANKSLSIEIYTARPGIVIGKAGAEVDRLKTQLEKLLGKEIQISVKEVKKPELDAYLMAENVAEQLVARVPFRRAMRRAVSAAIKTGAKGVKVACAGRLGGHEMARTEWYREGRVPLQTLRADIDYGFVNARTTFGSIGVKVWIYRGDVIGGISELEEEEKEKMKRRLEKIQAEKAAERAVLEEDLKKAEATSETEEEKSKPAEKEKAETKEVTEEKTEAKGKKAKAKKADKEEKQEEKPKPTKKAAAKKTTAKKDEKAEKPKKTVAKAKKTTAAAKEEKPKTKKATKKEEEEK